MYYMREIIQKYKNVKEELEILNKLGTNLISKVMLVPIDKSMLYIESIYEVNLNDENKITLKKVIVATGNKVGIGSNLKTAFLKLFTDSRINVEILNTDNREALIAEIIKMNNNLEQSIKLNNWEYIGKDINKMVNLVKTLEEYDKKQKEEKAKKEKTLNEEEIKEITENR